MAKRGSGCIRVVLFLFLVPIVFGLGVLLASNVSRVTTHDTAEGVIVDLLYSTDSDGDASYTPVYQYVVDGETYLHQSAVSFGVAIIPDIGDTRTILYDPDNPDDSRVRNIFLLIWLPIILMIIPVLIGVTVLWATRRKRRGEEDAPPWIDQVPAEQPQWTGGAQSDLPVPTDRRVIDALFMGTEPSQMDSEGNIRYRVKARAEIDGALHRFRSEWMDEDPTLHFMQHGNKVEVLVNPDDPGDYAVILPDVD